MFDAGSIEVYISYSFFIDFSETKYCSSKEAVEHRFLTLGKDALFLVGELFEIFFEVYLFDIWPCDEISIDNYLRKI